MEMTNKKLEELMSDEGFAEGWTAAETNEDILRLFVKYGIDITPEDVGSLLEEIPDVNSDELSDASLEGVAGGSILSSIKPTGRVVRNGGCGSRCPLCGKTNGFFGHVCTKFYLIQTGGLAGSWLRKLLGK